MIGFYLASDAWHERKPEQAVAYAGKAALSPATDSFPDRLTDIAVLHEVLQHDPKNSQAEYALGNFLFAHGRYEEAAALWQHAISGGFRNSVVLRNLGLYQWQVEHNLANAASYYSQAIRLSQVQYRLYTDLDEIYEQEGNAAAREELFRNAPPAVLNQDTVRARRAVLLIEQGKYNRALTSLAGHVFKPWEGGVAIHEIFVAANIEKGKHALNQYQPQEAAEAFRTAMQYPESLGTGEPDHPDLAEQDYWLGVALEAQGSHSQAEASWKKAAANGMDSGCAVYAGLAERKLGQQQASMDLLDKAEQAANRPGSTAADYRCAGVAEQMTDHPQLARSDFLQAIRMNPLFWQARLNLQSVSDGRQNRGVESVKPPPSLHR